MKSTTIHKIFGPPGTGKTRRLLQLMLQEIETVGDAQRIACVAITKAASLEIKGRIARQGDVKVKDLVWCRTMHSACYNLIGMTKAEQWGTVGDWQALRDAGFLCRGSFSGDEGVPPNDDKTFDASHFAWNMARKMRCPIEDIVTLLPQDNPKYAPGTVRRFGEAYERVKKERGKLDYEDMMERFLDGDFPPPPVESLLIDEAQDMTRLAWDVVRKWIKQGGIRRVYLAGDDDQSIYAFMGADEYGFLDFPADEDEVLHYSHRCPRAIGEYAEKILPKIRKRRQKRIEWRDAPGQVMHHQSSWQSLPWTQTAGKDKSYMVLCRHRRQVKQVSKFLTSIGVAHSMNGHNIRTSKLALAAKAYHDLKAGRETSPRNVAHLLRQLSRHAEAAEWGKRHSRYKVKRDQLTGIDYDRPWIPYIANDQGERQELQELRQLLVNYGIGVIGTEPNLQVMTYHGSKGREADVVVLLTDVYAAVWDSQARAPDPEYRLAYVGLTRARERAIVVSPGTGQYMIGMGAR